jgi:hypothetical protein
MSKTVMNKKMGKRISHHKQAAKRLPVSQSKGAVMTVGNSERQIPPLKL